jgi:hypothetical protein
LSGGIVDAVGRDLGILAEKYLTEIVAALQAVRIVDDLKHAGVTVLGSRMDGAEFTVNVATATDAAIVQSVGGSAKLGAPAAPSS